MDVEKLCAYFICHHITDVEGYYCIFISPQSHGCLPNHSMAGLDPEPPFN